MIENGSFHQQNRRLKILRIDFDSFLSLFTKNILVECIEGIPPKTELVGHWIDPRTNNVELKLQNNEFEVVPVGQDIPEIEVLLKSYWGKELQVMRKMLIDVKKAQDGPTTP